MKAQILDFLRSEDSIQFLTIGGKQEYERRFCNNKGAKYTIEDYTNVSWVGKNKLCFTVSLKWEYNGKQGYSVAEFEYQIGGTTKSGYLSTKKIDVKVADKNNITDDEVAILLSYLNSAKESKFDPFYAQNQKESANASAWSYIAQNHLQSDVRG